MGSFGDHHTGIGLGDFQKTQEGFSNRDWWNIFRRFLLSLFSVGGRVFPREVMSFKRRPNCSVHSQENAEIICRKPMQVFQRSNRVLQCQCEFTWSQREFAKGHSSFPQGKSSLPKANANFHKEPMRIARGQYVLLEAVWIVEKGSCGVFSISRSKEYFVGALPVRGKQL